MFTNLFSTIKAELAIVPIVDRVATIIAIEMASDRSHLSVVVAGRFESMVGFSGDRTPNPSRGLSPHFSPQYSNSG